MSELAKQSTPGASAGEPPLQPGASGRGRAFRLSLLAGAAALAAGGAFAQSQNYANGDINGNPVDATGGIFLNSLDNGLATQSGVISGAGGVDKTGAGTLVLAAPNTYVGSTTISAGALQISNDNNLGGPGGILNLAGGTLSLSAPVSMSRGINVTGTGTIDVGNTSGSTFNGALTGGGQLSLINSSNDATQLNRLILSNDGSGFTGSTQLGTPTSTGPLTGRINVVVTNQGALGNANNVTIWNNSELDFVGAAANASGLNITTQVSTNVLGTNSGVTFAGGASAGNATITTVAGPIAAGALVLFQDNSSAGSAVINNNNANGRLYFQNTSTGGTSQINNQGLAYISDTADLSTATVNNTGTGRFFVFQTTTGTTIGQLNGDGTVVLGGKALSVGSGNYSGVIQDTDPGTAYNSPVVTTGGTLTKTGAGTLVLSGTNTYDGGTTISGGTLQLGAGGTTGSIVGPVVDNGTLAFNRSDAVNFVNPISGTGSVTQAGSGTLSLAPGNTYQGGTTVNAGTLLVNADSSLGSGGLTLNGGTLRYGAGYASNRAVSLGAAGGTIDTNGNTDQIDGLVSGVGGLTKTGAGTLALTGANTYAGATTVNGGVLQIGADNNLGLSTAHLNLAGGTLQTTAALTSTRAITLGAGGGSIDTNGHPTELDGAIDGAGGLTKVGAGTLTLAGSNTYSGGTTISTGTLQVGKGGTAGAIVGNVANNGILAIDRSDSFTLAGNISGNGQLVQMGTGTLTLSGNNSYSGGTALKFGQINLGSSGALGTGALAMDDGTTLGFSANGLTIANAVALTGTHDPVIDTGSFTETLSGAITGPGALTKNGSGTLVLSGANAYTGATSVAAGTLRAGAANSFAPASAYTVASGATLDTAGLSQSVAALNNSGTVSLLGSAPGSTLTVTGAYVGNNGLLKLGTALGDSGSVSDRLVLNGAGASASGSTTIQITNLGGLGALTTGNGIDVVSAQNGATTTAQTTKSAFTLANGHVDAGAYQYRLYAADASGAGEDWYLRSTSTAPVIPPVNPPVNPPVTPPVTPPTNPTTPPALPTYRSEVPMYAALPDMLRQSDLAMLSNLHRRVGDDVPAAASADGSAATGGDRRAWARYVGSSTTIEQNGVTAPKSDVSMQGVQAGVDLFTNPSWHAGIYAGYLRSDSDVSGLYGLSFFNRAYAGSMRSDNTYLGGYATYANPQNQYADFVLQYGHHDISSSPVANFGSDSSGSSITASAEVGQRFPLGGSWGIEPQAQLIYMQQNLGNTLISGALVSQDAANAWIGRLGVRVAGDYATSAGRVEPYARLNVWHGFSATDNTSFQGPTGLPVVISNGIGYTSTEVSVGATLALTPKASVYGEIGTLFHTGGSNAQVSSSVEGSIGLKLKF